MHARSRTMDTVMLFVAYLVGCQGKVAYRTVPVSGILTCKGNPIAGVQILFSPRAENGRDARSPGRSAMARTDENGMFTLSTYGLDDGAVIGRHTVTILVLDDPRAPVSETAKKNVAPCINESIEVDVSPGMGEVAIRLGE